MNSSLIYTRYFSTSTTINFYKLNIRVYININTIPAPKLILQIQFEKVYHAQKFSSTQHK